MELKGNKNTSIEITENEMLLKGKNIVINGYLNLIKDNDSVSVVLTKRDSVTYIIAHK